MGSPFENSFDNTIHTENLSFSVIFNAEGDANRIFGENTTGRIIAETMHTHTYAELFMCFESGITIKTANGSIYLYPGELLLLPPGTAHIKLPDKSKWISVGFAYKKISTVKSHDFFTKIAGLCNCHSAKLISKDPEISSEIYRLFFNGRKKAYSVCDVFHILDILLRISDGEKETHGRLSNTRFENSRDIAQLSIFESIIETHFNESISAAKAAEMLHISERQLCRISKRHYNMPFHAVITDRRIKAACVMLKSTSVTAEKIGESVGFGNKASFFIAFKKKLGMTPTEYRRERGMNP